MYRLRYLGKPLQMSQSFLATLQQISYGGLESIGHSLANFYRLLEGISNPLTNFSEGIGNFCK
jgi:hypothetical protein